VTFSNVPAGTGYTVAASRYGQSNSVTSQSVTGGGTTNVTVTLAAFSPGSIKVTVKNSSGTNCSSISYNWTVSEASPPFTTSGTATTGSGATAGVLPTISGLPPDTGFSVTVTNASNSSRTGTTSGVTVTSGATTNVTVNLTTSSC